MKLLMNCAGLASNRRTKLLRCCSLYLVNCRMHWRALQHLHSVPLKGHTKRAQGKQPLSQDFYSLELHRLEGHAMPIRGSKKHCMLRELAGHYRMDKTGVHIRGERRILKLLVDGKLLHILRYMMGRRKRHSQRFERYTRQVGHTLACRI